MKRESRFESAGQLLAIMLLIGTAGSAHALDVGVTKGVGSDDFRSTGADIGMDFRDQTLRFDASYYIGESAGDGPDTSAASLRWQALPRLSASLSGSHIVSDITTMSGFDTTLGWSLPAPWAEQHPTTLSVTYGRLEYTANRARVLPAIRARVPRQTHLQVALSQQLSQRWSANLSLDDYRYDKDPIELATIIVLLGRRLHFPVRAAFNALTVPDHSTSAGLSWAPNDRYNVSLSVSDVRTVLDQSTKSVGLNAARTFGRFTVSGQLSHTDSGAAMVRNVTLLPSSTGTYFDLRVGAHF